MKQYYQIIIITLLVFNGYAFLRIQNLTEFQNYYYTQAEINHEKGGLVTKSQLQEINEEFKKDYFKFSCDVRDHMYMERTAQIILWSNIDLNYTDFYLGDKSKLLDETDYSFCDN